MAKRVIICASPRAMGKSVRAAKDLATTLAGAYPADDIETIRLSDLDIRYCQGCNTCGSTNECFIEDGMSTVLAALSEADVLYVVSPIYFAGPPANYKAMLDRLQPFFWDRKGGQPKRQVTLFAIGDGGDPHGHEPLIVCTRSALSLAGFELVATHAFIGKSSAEIATELSRLIAD